MTCPACDLSRLNPAQDWHWVSNCTGCMARALAATGAHVESASLGQIQMPYRIALEKLFGFSNWESGHAQVKEWAALIAQSRATERTT